METYTGSINFLDITIKRISGNKIKSFGNQLPKWEKPTKN